jgi:phosphoenolpyruvate synthase/pyruvate phosphate dikinase
MENSDFGFDGIYKTVVVEKCNLKKLKEACRQVLDSLFSEDAIKYHIRAGITQDSMRIIVQKFIGHKNISAREDLQYFVMETSINAQGDASVVMDNRHDFINNGSSYKELIMGKHGEILASTDVLYFLVHIHVNY